MGCEFILLVFEEIGLRSFPLRKTGMELHFATAVTLSAGSYLMIRELVPYVTWPRALCYESSCLMIRSWRCGLLAPVFPSALRSAIYCDATILSLPTNFIPICKNMAGDGVLTAKNV